MPRLIFKCPHIKGGTSAATAHLENYVKYVATRSGAERVDPGRSGWPATSNQKKLVEQILQDFPLSRGIFEYEDYAAAPTCANASEFITRALEDNYDQIAKKDNYLKYIATRPRAQRVGSHGLFTGEEDQLVLARVAEAVAAHPGNVWLPIISLRREDAARLGYDRAEEWKALLSKYAMEMAAAMKIPWEDFRWYAAFHDEAHHPHVHMVCYSADPSKGFLTKQGIAQIKSGLAKEIFRQELTELYQKQTQSRDALNEDARWVMEQLIEQMRSGAGDNDRMEELMEHLAERLRHTGGRKQYGYLKAPLKAVVDEIVDELTKEPCIAAAYALWYELREDVLRTYKDDLPPRLPLSQQKEFKRIKNIVIEEAVKLGARQQVFHPDDQGDGGAAAAQEAPPLSEPSQPDDGWGDPVEFPPESAPENDDKLQYRIGWRLLYGVGIGKDEAAAREWFERASKLGNPNAQYQLARMIFNDPSATPEQTAQALEWLTKAAEAGQDRAQYVLGKIYRDGQGTEKDIQKAVELFTPAAEQENSFAAFALGKLYLAGDAVLPKDPMAALKWLTYAAELGNQFAQYRLGKLLLQGEDVPRDIKTAIHWLTAAAEQGNQYAQYALGKLYLLGKEIPKDRTSATKWFQLAVDQGNEYAQYFLEHMDDRLGQPPMAAVVSLLHHLANIFQEQNQPPPSGGIRVAVDRKLLRKIRAKKIAQGHKADDHEPEMQL